MAKRIVEIFVDDINGETLEDADHEAVRFALDGVDYRIDLGRENASKLRAVFAPYISAGEKVGRSAPAPRTPRNQTSDIRAWARDNGYRVAARGRIPADVVQAYHSAH